MNSTKMGHKTFRVICYSADFLNENIKESVLNFAQKNNMYTHSIQCYTVSTKV